MAQVLKAKCENCWNSNFFFSSLASNVRAAIISLTRNHTIYCPEAFLYFCTILFVLFIFQVFSFAFFAIEKICEIKVEKLEQKNLC